MTNYLQGFPSLDIDPDKIIAFTNACMAKRVKYGLGSKDNTPKNPMPVDFSAIDCSGFFREAILYATGLAVLPPDGSYIQNDWCAAKSYKRSEFKNTLLSDGYVRVCFRRAKRGVIGHVWLTYMGKTYESWGGHGPGSRAASTPLLASICDDVYVLSGPKAPVDIPKPAAPAPAPAPVTVEVSPPESEKAKAYGVQMNIMKLKSDWQDDLKAAVTKCVAGRERYAAIAKEFGVDWDLVAVIAHMESGNDFHAHLANGDSLSARTKNVPAGLPKTGTPPFTWEEGARAALSHEGLVPTKVNSPGKKLEWLESWNGLGYFTRHVASPFLWSGTDQYVKGKFVADHVYDANAVSKQLGVAPLLKALLAV